MIRTNTHLTSVRGDDHFAGMSYSVSSNLSSISRKSMTREVDLSGEVFDFLLVRLRP